MMKQHHFECPDCGSKSHRDGRCTFCGKVFDDLKNKIGKMKKVLEAQGNEVK